MEETRYTSNYSNPTSITAKRVPDRPDGSQHMMIRGTGTKLTIQIKYDHKFRDEVIMKKVKKGILCGTKMNKLG